MFDSNFESFKFFGLLGFFVPRVDSAHVTCFFLDFIVAALVRRVVGLESSEAFVTFSFSSR